MSGYVCLRLISRMSATTKGHTVRVYLQDDDLAALEELATSTELAQTALATRLLCAALRAVRNDGGRVTLPLVLNVSHAAPAPPPGVVRR